MRTRRQWSAATWGAGAALAVLSFGTLGTGGCGGGEARAPNATKPIDERHAIEVIRRAVRGEGFDPAPGRDEKVAGNGKPIHIDVGIGGRRFGVAYITAEEAQELGSAIPEPNRKDEKLKLVPAGDDGKTHVLLLFQQNYLHDDLADVHEQTMITAEGALTRDVRDFLTYARSKRFD